MNNLQRKNRPIILVVDDDTLHLRMMELYLEDRFEVYKATSVPEAISYFKQYAFAIVLLDVSLEGRESGLDFCKYIRQSKYRNDTPIIALTAHVFPHDRKICLHAGCDEYMGKPIEKDELLEMMAKFLN